MWDNAEQINKVANTLFALVALMLFLAAGFWLINRPGFVLRALTIDGDTKHINVPTVRATLTPQLRRNLFTVDIEAVRRAFESMPWVRTASIRRVWPNQLIAELHEYQPLGVWGKDQLISVNAEVFTAHAAQADGNLPLLKGPPGSEKEVVTRYWDFMRWFAPLGLRLQSVTLSARYAWTVDLANGMRVELGRERDQATLAKRSHRLIFAWPKMIEQWGADIKCIDLRYPNGFAIRVSSAHPVDKQVLRQR